MNFKQKETMKKKAAVESIIGALKVYALTMRDEDRMAEELCGDVKRAWPEKNKRQCKEHVKLIIENNRHLIFKKKRWA